MIIRHIRLSEINTASEIESITLETPWSEKSIADFIGDENNIYLVCESDGVLCGIGGCQTVCGECNITNIAVLPQYRKHGIGSALLKELLVKAKEKGCVKAFLEVNEKNESAISLYKKFCFSSVGIRKNYYKNHNALLMTAEELEL